MRLQDSKSLVIVGNAPVKKDYSEFIDSCEQVIRFNRTPHYSNNRSGNKTSILCLRNVGRSAGEVFASSKQALNSNVVKQAQEIWFGRKHELNSKIIRTHCMEEKYIWNITSELRQKIREDIQSLVPTVRVGTDFSLGMLATANVLYSSRFNYFKKYMLGFTWQGCSDHPWRYEKVLCEKYFSEKEIINLEKEIEPMVG